MTDAADAEAFFAAKGWRLRTYEADGKWWTDLVSTASEFTAQQYGVGETAEASVIRAKARWDVEQEPPNAPPRRLP